MVRTKKWTNIFFLLGLASIVIMLCTFEISFSEVWNHIKKAGVWMPAILVLWLFLYILNCCTWRTILKGSGEMNVSFLQQLKITISGFAINNLTPCGLIGGEPYRILEMSRYIGTQRATSSSILFSMMHIFCHFWFWFTSIILFVILSLSGVVSIDVPVGIVLVFATIFCLFGIYLFCKGYKYGFAIKTLHLLGRVPCIGNWVRRFSVTHRESLLKIDRQIYELQSQTPRVFFKSFILEYVGRILQCVEIAILLQICSVGDDSGHTARLWLCLESFFILSFTSLFANILGFLPLQLGGREGGFALSVSQFGMTAGVGIFISVMCRIRELFWIIVGVLLIKVNDC